MVSESTVIIRSSGERTLALCRHLIETQVPEENIIVITESPFSRAVKCTFELGMERDLPWTLAIDADVLVADGGIAQLLEIAGKVGDDIFEVQGEILDKLFGGPKPGGPHLFRTSFLNKAITLMPIEGVSMRPEAFVMKQMASQGYPWKQADVVLGLHDYEQYFCDIYRKAFVHTRKHGHLVPYFEDLWRRLAEKDADFHVALWGLRAGRIYNGDIELDVSCFSQEIQTLLQLRSLKEKGDLPSTVLSPSEINHLIDTFTTTKEYWSYRRIVNTSNSAAQNAGLNTRLNEVLKRTGRLRILPWLIGWGFGRIGRVLQTWAER